MNEAIIENWNRTVNDEHDIVIFLGDLGNFADDDQLRYWFDRLNGRIIFVKGNHDSPRRYTDGVHTHQYYILSIGDQEFCCTHRPENAPRFWDGWIIHGHHHNNDLEKYPFIDPQRKRANVSAELLGYEPLAENTFINYIQRNEVLRTEID